MSYDDPYGDFPPLGTDQPGAGQGQTGYDPYDTPPVDYGFNDSTDVTGSPNDTNTGWPISTLPDGGGQGAGPWYGPDTPSVGNTGGGGGFLDSLKKILSGGKGKINPKQLAALALMARQLFGGKGGSMADILKQNPSLDSLMKLQSAQAQRQDPLHKAVTQLATNLLPNSAFGAGPNRPEIG